MTNYQTFIAAAGRTGMMRNRMRKNSCNNLLVSAAALATLAFGTTAWADMGRTAGSWGVARSGSATYSIPMWVQPGPKGIQPSMAFVYDSQAGNGTLGVGWGLAGFSSIDRCPRTLLDDGEAKPLNFDQTDRFCLDGNKLRITSGPVANYGDVGAVYRTVNDQFARITSVGGTAANGPLSFEVHTKGGLILEYGVTSDSRIELGGGKVYRWLLNKVRDRDNNSYIVTYTTDNAVGRSPATVSWGPTSSGVSTYLYRATFNYTPKWNPNDWVTARVGSVDLIDKQRLNSVVIEYSANGSTYNPVRQYRLGYTIQTPTGEKDVSPSTGRTRLSSVKECAASETNCLKPTVMTYQERAPGLASTATSVPSVNGANATRYDFNGDGRTDLAFYSNTWKVAFSTGNAFTTPVDTGISNASPRIGRFAATNVDGFLYSVSNVWRYVAYNGTAFTGTSTGTPVAAGTLTQSTTSDANGDGLVDLVFTTTGRVGNQRFAYVNVRLNTTTGVATVPTFSSTTYVALTREVGPNSGAINILPNNACPSQGHCDLNGDGTPDHTILLTTTFGCGSSGCSPVTTAYEMLSGSGFYALVNPRSTVGSDPYVGIRFNSDPCVDTIQFNTLTLRVNPCGKGTGATITLPAPYVTFLDWNSDGKSDLIANNGGVIGVYLSTGSITQPFETVISTSIPYNSACKYFPADVDADGLDELVCATNTSAMYYLPQGGGSIGSPGGTAVFITQVADLLSSITDGYGLAISPSYVSIPQSNYTKGATIALPLVEAADIKYVVGRIRVSDGFSVSYELDYTYKGMRRNIGRETLEDPLDQDQSGSGAKLGWSGEFVGFEEINVVDNRNGTRQRTTFEQLYPRDGMVNTSEASQSGGAIISSIRNNNQVHILDSTTGNTRYVPYVFESVSDSHEIDGDLIATAKTTFEYSFEYGNLTKSTTVVTDKDAAALPSRLDTTSTTEVTNAFAPPLTSGSDWCVGLVTRTDVVQSSSVADVNTVTRAVGFAADVNNPSKCRVKTRTVEPANAQYEVVETYDYDAFGNVRTIDLVGKQPAANGGGFENMPLRRSSLDWGSTGQFLVSTTDPSGAVAKFEYNPKDGTLKDSFDPNSGDPNNGNANIIKSSFLYDDFARLTRATNPDGTYTSIAYEDCTVSGCVYPTHRMTVRATEIDRADHVITDSFTYGDVFGRPFVTRSRQLDGDTWNGSYQWSETQYDIFGRVHKEYVPCTTTSPVTSCRLHAVTNSYDLLNRLTQLSRPRSASDTALQNTTLTHDGLTQTVVDPLEKASIRVVNVDGTVRKIVDANGYGISFQYDAAGTVTKITDSDGHDKLSGVTVNYGLNAFQVRATDSAVGLQTRTFNSLGELIAWTDANGQNFSATYDLLSRPLTRLEPGATTSWSWGDNKLAYNVGRLRHVESTADSETYQEDYTYDPRARLAKSTITIPGQGSFDYDYTYDPDKGWVDTLTYPVSTPGYRLALRYGYQNGILRSVADANAGTEFWRANNTNAWGQLTQETLGNSIIKQRSIDPVNGRLASILSGPNGNPTQIQSLSYLYDLAGNVTQRQNSKVGMTESFYYGSGTDNLQRLAYSTLNNGTTTVTNLTLKYDKSGNIKEKNEVGLNEPLLNQTVTWTSYNYPLEITAGGEKTTFAYGPNRQRWEMSYQVGGITETTHYIGGLLERVAIGANVQFRHTISTPGGAAAIYTRSNNASPSLRYVFDDNLGSVESLLDSATGTITRASFSAYGTRRNETTWSGDATNRAALDGVTRTGYTSQTVLGSTGLNHMNGRVQDAVTGRFLSPDPYVTDPGYTQNYNRYSYVYNNPLTYTDPSGFDPEPLPNCRDPRDEKCNNARREYERREEEDRRRQEQERDAERRAAYESQNNFSTYAKEYGKGAFDTLGASYWQMPFNMENPGFGGGPANLEQMFGPYQSGFDPPATNEGQLARDLGATGPVLLGVLTGRMSALKMGSLPKMSPLLQRYLAGSGGRWGSRTTRAQNHNIASTYETGGYRVTGGAGRASEEWIAGPKGGTKGGTFVDITVTNGKSTIRIQTIDTLADGVTPTVAEAAAAARIRAAFPNDQLILVPKL